jgi:hypothetical protein
LFYDYNNHNNKTEKRKEKIKVLKTEKMKTKLSDSNIKIYFLDVIYRIIPKRHKENKLLAISGYDNITKMTYICTLIILKYEDVFTFKEIFKYMNNLYKSSPVNVHLDYCLPLRKVILFDEAIFQRNPLLIHY